VGGWITDNYSWRWIFFTNVPVAIVSLLLTNRVVEDPPYLEAEVRKARSGLVKIDYTGFALTALAFGSLEVVLDKGQEDDWFGSTFIVTFLVLCIVGLTSLIVWELSLVRRGLKPIIDLRLYRNRTFALSFGMMFVLGVALYGTTVLIPQLLQTLMGYTATSAGMTLSLGGLATIMCMPLVGVLISRVDPRYLLAFGFAITAIALFHMTNITLEMSSAYAARLRFFQACGLGFLFIPIQTLAYTDVPMERNNEVAGLTNLARNIGGSVGTALVTTLLARQAQRHQTYLGAHVSGSEGTYRNSIEGLTHRLLSGGFSPAQTNAAAMQQIYRQLNQQANLLPTSTSFSYSPMLRCVWCRWSS
jgi:DHA2 family multidrug resistance protein